MKVMLSVSLNKHARTHARTRARPQFLFHGNVRNITCFTASDDYFCFSHEQLKNDGLRQVLM